MSRCRCLSCAVRSASVPILYTREAWARLLALFLLADMGLVGTVSVNKVIEVSQVFGLLSVNGVTSRQVVAKALQKQSD